MPEPIHRAHGSSAIVATGRVADGATYRLPDGQEVRAFVHASPTLLSGTGRVTLHTAEEWAMDDLPHYTLDRRGRVLCQDAGAARPRATAWTAADLAPGDALAWDAAVHRLGGAPWLPIDLLPAEG